MILKYIEGIIRDDSPERKTEEGSSSKVKGGEPTLTAMSLESEEEVKADDEQSLDRNKFRKVEMPVFNGTNQDSWLFRADHYFKIHNLMDSKKLTMAAVSFDGPALDWYRSQEEREA